jgi:hypothetical protein
VIISIGTLLNAAAASVAKWTAETRLEAPYTPLPDIVHDRCPRIARHTPDYLLMGVIAASFAKSFFLPISQAVLGSNLNALGYSLLLRSFTVMVTVMPTCNPRPGQQNLYQRTFTSTHDLMFSGHTLVFTFFGKLIAHECCLSLYWLGQVVQYCMPVTLVLSRQHYTTDVVVSAIVYRFFLLSNMRGWA